MSRSSSARLSALTSTSRRGASASISRLYSSERDCARLACDIAVSARWSRSSASSPCSGEQAIPTLASTLRFAPATSNGRLSASRILTAAASASALPPTAGSSTAKRSPSMRATVSLARTVRASRPPTSIRRASPWSRPSVSFTSRKRARSSVSTAAPSPPVGRRIACAVRWVRSARLGSEVSGSCSARYSISDAWREARWTAAIGSASAGTR